jgi:hypothetical protein
MISELYAGIKTKPGTCEACVWGRGKHAEGCEVDQLLKRMQAESAQGAREAAYPPVQPSPETGAAPAREITR